MLKSFKFSKAGLVVTTVLLVFSMLLAACGGNNTNNGNASPAEESSAAPAASSAAASEPAAAELPEVKLTWYFAGNFPQPDQDEVFAAVNKVIKEKINATV